MALFRDLLKKWFYTNSSSAASSDARIPLLTATGEPKGSDTMANIASVLGGMQFRRTLGENDSWDDLIDTGYYVGNPSPNRTPTSWAHLLNFYNTTFRLQILFENSGGKGVWYRTVWGVGSEWSEWNKIH